MFFTNAAASTTLKCYQIPGQDGRRAGMAIVNLLQIAGDKKVTAMIPVPRGLEEHYLVMMTRNGMIKRTPWHSEFPPTCARRA